MNSGLASSESSSLPRVAVIAVDGVNANEPFVMARTIARTLLRRGLTKIPNIRILRKRRKTFLSSV